MLHANTPGKRNVSFRVGFARVFVRVPGLALVRRPRAQRAGGIDLDPLRSRLGLFRFGGDVFLCLCGCLGSCPGLSLVRRHVVCCSLCKGLGLPCARAEGRVSKGLPQRVAL